MLWILALLLLPIPIAIGRELTARRRLHNAMLALDVSDQAHVEPVPVLRTTAPEQNPWMFGSVRSRPASVELRAVTSTAVVPEGFGTPTPRTTVVCNVRGVPCGQAAICSRQGCRLVA